MRDYCLQLEFSRTSQSIRGKVELEFLPKPNFEPDKSLKNLELEPHEHVRDRPITKLDN